MATMMDAAPARSQEHQETSTGGSGCSGKEMVNDHLPPKSRKIGGGDEEDGGKERPMEGGGCLERPRGWRRKEGRRGRGIRKGN